ncbi:MAG: T9SS type A sorting domain-containing protein [Ignavibacteria bacterium]
MVNYTDTLVSVNSIAGIVPEEFKLYQNYPNPFNPTTNLEFGISELGLVSLKVYNALGIEVAVLVNENKPAGKYSVQFDGANYPSGIYYYKLESGDFSEVRKMILLK